MRYSGTDSPILSTREFLSKEEIHLLMETPITRKKMSMVRDLFLFCCFTGLAFIDLYNLKEENIKEFFDEGEWIVIHRQKTGTEANIKLLDYPKQIMEKYRGLCEDGRVFPVPNYQSCMDSLKRLGKKCGITKPLSWHMRSHSKFFYLLNISELSILKNVTANDLETSYILFLSQPCNIQRTPKCATKIRYFS